jgi:DNA helicase-2/ATP-dependent DNA helicase PcrA
MKRAIAAAGISTTHASPEQIASSISRAKNRLATPEMMEGHALSPQDTIAAKVYPVYQQQLLTANAVDFDDLLLHVAMLLRSNPELRSELDTKYKYILVDEYQDTNLAQYAIVRALSVDHPNLAVTGDPDQSIYGWRGADVNNILDFEKDYPNVKTVRLEKNYRSTPGILRAADHLIRHNQKRKQKELFTDIPEGDPVVLRIYEDGYKEADGIVDDIADRIGGGQFKASDFAIFCRMNALTRSLEHAFRSRAIPYQIVGGVEFYQRREIKDLLAYLHLINNPNHDVAFQRVVNTPTRGIGAKTVERIRDYADSHRIPLLDAAREASSIDSLAKRAKTMIGKFVTIYDRVSKRATSSLEDLIRYVVEETAYEDYLEKTAVEQQDANPMANVDEFIAAAVEFDRQHPDDGSLDLFLEQVALVADTDKFDGESERVTLMTLHAAKGLEFPCVYIIGVEDDLIPHARSKSTESEFEEERRLLFVGITRAMQRLQLSVCKRRAVRGDIRPVIPSPFLNELPLGEIKRIESASATDYFDDDFGDELNQDSYPDSWDLPGENDASEEQADAPEFGGDDPDVVQEPGFAIDSQLNDSEVIGGNPPTPKAKPKSKRSKPVLSGLKTGAEFLSGDQTPLTAYREGATVNHPDHGQGMILTVTGRGPKRTAKVQFLDGEHSFRLAYAKLELVEG